MKQDLTTPDRIEHSKELINRCDAILERLAKVLGKKPKDNKCPSFEFEDRIKEEKEY